jgi:U4/U6.U5 tri-snRNP component SNU23
MSDGKKTAYGSAGNDVSFRRTWDRAEYASRAAARDAQERADAKARAEARAAGKKWVAPRRPGGRDGGAMASSPLPAERETEARVARLDVAAMVGKTMLVPAGAAVGRRGRGAGFYCEACDLTFKDNLQLVDHYNSKQHQVAVGESGEVRRASGREVRERLRYLKRKMEEERRWWICRKGCGLRRRRRSARGRRRGGKGMRRGERRRMGLECSLSLSRTMVLYDDSAAISKGSFCALLHCLSSMPKCTIDSNLHNGASAATRARCRLQRFDERQQKLQWL